MAGLLLQNLAHRLIPSKVAAIDLASTSDVAVRQSEPLPSDSDYSRSRTVRVPASLPKSR